MQSPEVIDQFIAAIREANLEKVKNMLDAQPSLQKSIRDYYNYTSDPILKFAVRNPELKGRYMQIARFLVDRGARVHPDALVQLQSFEALQKPAAKPAGSGKPVLAPITKPASPKPVAATPAAQPVTPIAKPARAMPVTPVPAPTIKPVSKPTGKTPADFVELREIARHGDFEKTKAYLDTHDITNLTAAQKEEIISNPMSNLTASGPLTPEKLHSYRRMFALLQKNGFEIKGVTKTYYERGQRGNFGPRAGFVESLLNTAIKNKDLNRVKQLVEQEDADVNATDTMGLSPLIIAAQVGAEAIAKYLYSHGARLYENNYYENRQFKPVLQKWGIPVN
jgi:hypothetical protein